MAAKKKTAKKPARKAAAKKKAPARKAAKKAPARKAKKGSKAIAEMIISKSRTKNAVQACNVSGDFYGALNEKVIAIIAEAEARASANGRKTLRPQDL